MSNTTPDSAILIIVNDIAPYGTEIVNVLALPSLAECRFRYQSKYIPTIKNYAGLNGRVGTIVVRDFQTGTFIPVRSFRVSSVRIVGDIVYLTVELRDIVAIRSVQEYESRNAAFNEKVAGAIGEYANPPNDNLMNLILYENTDIYSLMNQWQQETDRDEISHWGNCVSILASRFAFGSVDFYKIVALRNADGNVVPFQATDELSGYSVIANETYTLEILQRTYTQRIGDSSVAGDHFMEIQSSDPGVSVLWNSRRILGKYDLLQFPIAVGLMGRPTANLFISSTTNDPTLFVPAVEIPLHVKVRTRSKVLNCSAIVLLALLSLLYVLSGVIQPYFPACWNITEAAIEKLALLGMVLSSIPVRSLWPSWRAPVELGAR